MAVLNELPHQVMAAVNGALRPHRELAAHLTRLLPIAPHNDGQDPAPSRLALGDGESALIGWHIAALCFDQHKAATDIERAINLSHQTTFGRRIHSAAEHFVMGAVLKTESNRQVGGGMADVGGATVRVPLQCFQVVGGVKGRVLGLREVVHKARMDEAVARGGLHGLQKGFNQHLGDIDCHFAWPELGYVNGDGSLQPLHLEDQSRKMTD
ncbi:unnamed protein product [Vitrella brassicaformis CCMP3155]|uniref:Uncharacterized protein n=1 Tax=Vitrella brassicaformis (strain CCMP3155) TaxID=1169540 RepID=A0A0G4GZU9_VITBC|nr:unnamed protein product [Vitrella brassicaformis CCMP3155]|eukprot:CEM36809.1 unnamed protein product [Vitrella brassicaformis CCMP3155]